MAPEGEDIPRNVSRDRGILNERERKYLLGESEIEPKSADERSVRGAIRSHLRNAVLDSPILLNCLERRDIDQAFEESNDTVMASMRNSIPSLLGLLYLAGLEQETKPNAPYEGWLFEDGIENGIQRALNRLGVSVEDVSVDISIDRGEELADLAAKGLSELSKDELRQLLWTEDITNDEFSREMIRRQNEPSEQDKE